MCYLQSGQERMEELRGVKEMLKEREEEEEEVKEAVEEDEW